MRLLAAAALVLLLSTGTAWAQRGGGRGGGFGGGAPGFQRGGGVGITTGIPRGGAGFHRGVHPGFRGVHPGFRGHVGFGPGFHARFFGLRSGFSHGFAGHRGGFFIPYSYVLPAAPAVAFGAPYVWDYSTFGYPSVAAVAPPAYAPPPIVIQQYDSPVIRNGSRLIRPYVPPARELPARELPEDRSAVIYLLAFTDTVIRPALAYWVEAGTVHYVGLDRKQRQAALDTVDRALSSQLNRERGVPFRLPAPQ
jgi:hypothetical protein